jgi:hypothetical protein
MAYSDDYGATWSVYQNNLDKPYIGPGSKFFICKLSSGNLLMVNHDTSSSRSDIRAYLSTDDGNTWPYSISIDKRDDVSYPSAYETDGNIYVVWDKGRYIEKEIRLSVMTEDDIKAGQYVSDVSIYKSIISKTGNYLDIVSVNNAFNRTITEKVGTTSSSIRAQLPTEIVVTDEQGIEHTLNGSWSSKGYKQDIAGYYIFEFIVDSMPLYLQDGKDILSIRVQLVKEDDNKQAKKGCKSSISTASFMVLTLLLFGFIKNK